MFLTLLTFTEQQLSGGNTLCCGFGLCMCNSTMGMHSILKQPLMGESSFSKLKSANDQDNRAA